MAVDDAEDDQLASMSTEDIIRASRLLDNEIRVLKASRALPTLDPSRLRRMREEAWRNSFFYLPERCWLGFAISTYFQKCIANEQFSYQACI